MTSKRIRTIYGIVLSCALVLAGLCLIGACLDLYLEGGEPVYSAQKVAAAFRPIAIPVYLALALTLGGFLLELALPARKDKVRTEKNRALILENLHKKQDISLCGDAKLRTAVAREQAQRRWNDRLTLILLGLGAAVLLVYSNTAHFPNDAHITAAVLRGSLVMAGCFLLPFGFGIYGAYANRRSMDREIGLMKLVAAPRQESLPEKLRRDTLLRYGKWALLALALVMILLGYSMDGWRSVVTKAVNICRECVGLG